MRRKEYACPNGCSLPPRRKQLREYSDGTYGFDFYDFTFCPCCGSLMPYSLKKLKNFFDVYNIHTALTDAVQLVYKSEFESAAREAFVAVENYLKKKSGLPPQLLDYFGDKRYINDYNTDGWMEIDNKITSGLVTSITKKNQSRKIRRRV